MSTRRILLFIPFLIALGLGLFLWKGLDLDPNKMPSALIGKPFPQFNIESLQNPEKMLTAADLKGKSVLVNVWGTWCPACKVEHPYLVEIAKQGVPIIGINYKDNRASAKQWLAQLGNPYVFNIYDKEGHLGLDLGVYGAPETYVVDAQGIIRYRHAGPVDSAVWQEIKPFLTN